MKLSTITVVLSLSLGLIFQQVNGKCCLRNNNIITPRAHARSGVKQWVLSVSQSVCHQNSGLITTTKGLNASKRHSNSDNSEKTVHGVPEGG